MLWAALTNEVQIKCNIYDEISIIEGIAKIFERNFNKYL